MTDQDLDSSHIKGLCINMFQSKWHDLFTFKGFMGFMNTPIIKAKRGKKTLSFYNNSDYLKWKEADNGGKGWTIKYFKLVRVPVRFKNICEEEGGVVYL